MAWEDIGNYYCRKCGSKGFLSSHESIGLTREELGAIREERDRKIRAEREMSLKEWQATFDFSQIQKWHSQLTPKMRDEWNVAGIPDAVLDSYCVGYTQKFVGGIQKPIASYTIPIISNETNKVINIQYRLIDPPAGVGKYRQVSNIPAAPAYMSSATEGDVLVVVEGWKKAVVVFEFLGKTTQVVGIPGISPHDEVIRTLSKFKKVILIPDPFPSKDRDLFGRAVKRFSSLLENLYLVSLFEKPDDLIISGAVSLRQFNFMLDNARKMS